MFWKFLDVSPRETTKGGVWDDDFRFFFNSVFPPPQGADSDSPDDHLLWGNASPWGGGWGGNWVSYSQEFLTWPTLMSRRYGQCLMGKSESVSGPHHNTTGTFGCVVGDLEGRNHCGHNSGMRFNPDQSIFIDLHEQQWETVFIICSIFELS